MSKKSKINTNNVILGIIYVIIGALLCVFRGGMLNVFFTVMGILLLAYGIYDVVQKIYVEGIILIVFGILILVGGWTILNILLLVVGAILIAYGAYGLIKLASEKSKDTKAYIVSAVTILIGIWFIAMRWYMVDWFIIALGVIAIIDGILLFFSK